MSKSAAIPADLQAYAGRAVELDGQLHDAAARLHMATQAFRDSSPEYGGVPDLETRVAGLSGSCAELDAWVGRVGEAFDRADRRPADRLAKVDDRVLARELERENRRDGESLEQRYADTRRQIEQARDATAAALATAKGKARGPLTDRLKMLNHFLDDPGPDGKPRQFLFFDPSGDGRVAEVMGDLQHADSVAVIVPGMDNTVNNFGKLENDAVALRDAASTGQHQVATIAWLGYDTPDGGVNGGWDVAHDGTAKKAAHSLVDFMGGLHLGDGVTTTVIGHSYGSLVVGHALRDGLRVDNAVVIGSPGIGFDHLDELHLPKGTHFYAGRANLDPVPYFERFGRDPSDARFGGTRFATGSGREGLVSGHADHNYFMDDSDSLRNMADITVGDYAHVTTKSRSVIEQGAAAFDRGERAVNGVVHDAQHGVDSLQKGVDRGVDDAQSRIDNGLGPLASPFDLAVDADQEVFDGAVNGAQAVVDVGVHDLEAPADFAVGAIDRGGALAGDAVDKGKGWVGGACNDVEDFLGI